MGGVETNINAFSHFVEELIEEWMGYRFPRQGGVKVSLCVAKGKKNYDKRETIRRREIDRETRALVKERMR